MLQLFAFDSVGIAVGDIYFEDPEPAEGQDGLERGVRLELRRVSQLEHSGSIYAAHPILIGEPLWRCDLLEAAGSPSGSFDRTHHHPEMIDWEPGDRCFDEALSREPLAWLEAQLSDMSGMLARDDLPPADAAACVEQIRESAPEIVAAVRRLLDRVWTGTPPVTEADRTSRRLVRTGWL